MACLLLVLGPFAPLALSGAVESPVCVCVWRGHRHNAPRRDPACSRMMYGHDLTWPCFQVIFLLKTSLCRTACFQLAALMPLCVAPLFCRVSPSPKPRGLLGKAGLSPRLSSSQRCRELPRGDSTAVPVPRAASLPGPYPCLPPPRPVVKRSPLWPPPRGGVPSRMRLCPGRALRKLYHTRSYPSVQDQKKAASDDKAGEQHILRHGQV